MFRAFYTFWFCVLMGLGCTLQAQTLVLQPTGLPAPHAVGGNVWTVCQGNGVHLQPAGLPACASVLHRWLLPGQPSVPPFTAGLPSAWSIPDFQHGHMGSYCLELDCNADGQSDFSASVFLMSAANPQAHISQAPGLCLPTQPSGSWAQTLGTQSVFRGECVSCDSTLGFAWVLENLHTGLMQTLPYTGKSFALSPAQVSGLQPHQNTPLRLHLQATDAWGCIWAAPPVDLQAYVPPTGWSGQPDTILLGLTPVPVSLLSGIQGNTVGFSLSASGAGSGWLSGWNYYPLVAGTEQLLLQAQAPGCAYQTWVGLHIEEPGAFGFVNLNKINAVWEACVGDTLEFAYSAGLPLPRYAVLGRRGGGIVAIELEGCLSGNCSGLPSGTPQALAQPVWNGAPAALASRLGRVDVSARKIRLAVPANAATGGFCLYADDPTAGGALTVCASAPSLLAVHNPEVGFAVGKSPLCYGDRVALTGFPSGGRFTAAQSELDWAAGLPSGSGFVPAAALLDTSGGLTFLNGSGIQVQQSVNDGGQAVLLTYAYTPLYTDGQACSQALTHSDTLAVYDNRGIGFSLPLAVQGSPNVWLQSAAGNISPLPSFASASDYVFSGTFVQPAPGGGQEFLVQTAGLGEFSIRLDLDNRGCPIQGTALLRTLPAPRFVGLPTAMCRSIGQVFFGRDTAFGFNATFDTLLSCTQQQVVQQPMGPSLRPDKDGNEEEESNEWRSYTFSCTPAAVEDRRRFAFVGLEVFGLHPDSLPPGASPLATLSASGTAWPLGALSIEHINTPQERLMFNAQHAAFAGLPRVFVRMRMETRRGTCPVLAGSVSGSGPYTFALSVCNPDVVQQQAILQEIELYNNVGISIDNIPNRLCYNQTPLQIVSTPAYEIGFSRFTLRALNGSATDTLLLNHLDIASVFNNQASNAWYELTYTHNKYYGCDSIATQAIEVVAAQPTAFVGNSIGYQNQICVNAPEELFSGVPSPTAGQGGWFSGNGMAVDNAGNAGPNFMFSPRTAGVGSHLITYSHTDVWGCVSSVQRLITVRPQPSVQLSSPNPAGVYCANQTAVPLSGSPHSSGSGGSGLYFGPTIAAGDSVFRPNWVYLLDSAAAGGGVQVYYRYTDSFGCQATDTLTLQVRPVPQLQIQGLAQRYCANAPVVHNLQAIDLTGIAALQGFFWGDGIVAGTSHYAPAQAGTGWDTVYYSQSNVYGCSSTIFRTVFIDTVPSVSFVNLDTAYCANAPAFVLQALPGGGAFSGSGVVFANNVYSFNAQQAVSQGGLGKHAVRYTYTDGQGCTGQRTDTVRLRGLPTGSFGLAPSYCADAPSVALSASVPAGVTAWFSGGGVSGGGILQPASAPVGLNAVTLHLTDSVGCQNAVQQFYVLNPLPVVALMGVQPSYCNNQTPAAVQGFPQALVLPSGVQAAPPFAHFRHNLPSGAFSLTNAWTASAQVQWSGMNPGTHYLVYEYTDERGCTGRDSQTLFVAAAPLPSILNLAADYCETQDTFVLTASPAGGAFSGAGTQFGTPFFMPFRAGAGTHSVQYTVSESHLGGGLVCSASATQTVNVRPLPVPRIDFPTDNSRFCAADSAVALQAGISLPATLSVEQFSGAVGYALVPVVVFIPPWGNVTVWDTVWQFQPGTVGPGTHRVVYTATNQFGCTDSMAASYVVDPMPQPAFALPGTFCESDPAYPLAGSPAPGLFYRNGQLLASNLYQPNPFYPTLLLDSLRRDTLVYTVSNGQCTASRTQYAEVRPVPRVEFQARLGNLPVERVCIGDTLILNSNIGGGIFLGNGVLFGSNRFLPGLSGVGAHRVEYRYTDTVTGCFGSFADTLSVYNRPRVRLSSLGDCQAQRLVWEADNGALGLNGQFQGALFDQITQVRWDLGDGTLRNGTWSGSNVIDSIQHAYQQPGVYTVRLYVENAGLCSDEDSLRKPVSPSIKPRPELPYFEGFEQSSGFWLEEAEGGNAGSGLWEWGIADKSVIKTPGNRVWITRLQGSYAEESGWVYAPCLDLSELDRPMLSLDYFSDTDRGNDGAVIEYYHPAQDRWLPLGLPGRGIHWYDSAVIAGRPGVQDLAPMGWTGEEDDWKNARYVLDEFKAFPVFRFRIAFGAVGVHNRNLDGFAFDKVWVGNRSRNLLVEHFSNAQHPGMNAVNRHVYQTVFSPQNMLDAVLLHYATDHAYDEHFQQNPADANARRLYYGVSAPGRSVLGGKRFEESASLNTLQFEQAVLQSPAFSLHIEEFSIDAVGRTVRARLRLRAEQALPYGAYTLRMAVTEDSAAYHYAPFALDPAMGLMRKLLPDAGGTLWNRAWLPGEEQTVEHTWQYDPLRHNPLRLELTAFVQNEASKEVYQALCSRDVSELLQLLPDETPQAQLDDMQRLQPLRLFPNPARTHCTLEWQTPSEEDWNWELTDALGIRLQSGLWVAGSPRLDLNVQELAAGSYWLSVSNRRVRKQCYLVVMR